MLSNIASYHNPIKECSIILTKQYCTIWQKSLPKNTAPYMKKIKKYKNTYMVMYE